MPISTNEKLWSEVNPYFASHGFTRIDAPPQFRKVHKGGFECVVISVGNTLPTLAELHVGIRLDTLEQLVYQFTAGLNDYGPHSTTLITSSGRILGQPYHRFSIEQASDIYSVAEQMKQFMQSDGFAFLEKYRHLKALDALFNDEPDEKSIYLTNELHRSLRGITLAKLAQRDNWTQLVIDYRIQLTRRGTPETAMKSYDLLADYLRYFSIN